MTIVVAGIGYVGLSNAILLAQHNTVVAIDRDQTRVDQVNSGISPVIDTDMTTYLREVPLSLSATTANAPYDSADLVVVATPTDYDPATHAFDTSTVEAVIRTVTTRNPSADIVVKSTVPVGFVDRMRRETGSERIMFSPEFLREGRALYDNLHPSRIVIGDRGPRARTFAQLLKQGAKSNHIPTLFTDPSEAEAIKLFSNSYLAMRVAYFNELDSYAMSRSLDTAQIVNGIGLDPRIGTHYNNPSFGYGGYCLPKDTKQLLANFHDVPQNLIRAIVEANETRKDFLTDHILAQNPSSVGIYRLVMKTGSDNFRHSSILGIIDRLQAAGIDVNIYEPTLASPSYCGAPLIPCINKFADKSDLILANRKSEELAPFADRVFSRDLFGAD